MLDESNPVPLCPLVRGELAFVCTRANTQQTLEIHCGFDFSPLLSELLQEPGSLPKKAFICVGPPPDRCRLTLEVRILPRSDCARPLFQLVCFTFEISRRGSAVTRPLWRASAREDVRHLVQEPAAQNAVHSPRVETWEWKHYSHPAVLPKRTLSRCSSPQSISSEEEAEPGETIENSMGHGPETNALESIFILQLGRGRSPSLSSGALSQSPGPSAHIQSIGSCCYLSACLYYFCLLA